MDIKEVVSSWYRDWLQERGFIVETGLQTRTIYVSKASGAAYPARPLAGSNSFLARRNTVRSTVEIDFRFVRFKRPGKRWAGRIIITDEHARLTPMKLLPPGSTGAVEYADPSAFDWLDRTILALGDRR